MAILSTDIHYRLSGGAANSDPLLSLGGAKSSVAATGGTILDVVLPAEGSAGDVEYRCVYVHNNHGSLSLDNSVLWIQASGLGGNQAIAIAEGTSAINGTEQTVANEGTAPTGVTWSAPATKGAGIALGNLPAGQHQAIWIRRTVTAGAPASNSTFTLRVEGDTAP